MTPWRLFAIYRKANAVGDLLTRADATPARYRDAQWWARLLRASYELFLVVPIGRKEYLMRMILRWLKHYKTTTAGVAILAAAVAKVANDPSALFDPTTIAMFGAGWAALSAKDDDKD